MDKDISAYFPVHGEKGSTWHSPEQVCSVLLFGALCVQVSVLYPLRCCCLVKKAGIKCTQDKEENSKNF